MKALKLADNLSLPLDIAGQTLAIFGIRGSGKTNTAGVIVEELLTLHQPIVIIDPTDAWWGLRVGKDGNPAGGFPVFIFGGSHGDIPLQETDGKVIAEFLVNEQVPVILSLRHLRKNAQRRFVTEFCEELYHLKGKPENKTPLTVVIDEAPLFVPAKVLGEVARTVGAVEDLISRGRVSGFGVILISQRSATLNADVRSAAETIICHRMTSALDRRAISDWFEDNATTDNLKAILSSLAPLKDGEAWVWAPGIDVMDRTRIRLRRTFDSSKTPKIGEVIRQPKNLAEIDLGKLRDRLASTIEKSKADDPKELRRQIADLQRQVRELGSRRPEAAETVTVEVLGVDKVEALQRSFAETVQSFERCLANHADTVKRHLEPIAVTLRDAAAKLKTAPLAKPTSIIPKLSRPQATPRPAVHSSAPSDLSGPEQRILDAIAWLEGIGVDSPEQTAVAFLAGYTIGGGGFNNPRGALRTKGLLEYVVGDKIRLTPEGRGMANSPKGVLTTAELHRAVLDRLPGPEQRILQVILDQYPKSLTNEECAGAAGYTAGAGGYNNPRGRLRTLGLIEYPEGGKVRARDILFLEG